YGFVVAGIGLGPIYVSLFKLISGITRLLLGYRIYLKGHSRIAILPGTWNSVNSMFKASLVFALIEILGVIYNKTNIFFLQKETGLNGVAYYSAAWNIVDAISVLASDQFLGWVIFPLLATLWWKDRKLAGDLVRRNAQWLMAIALPVVFILFTESSMIISLIYPTEYSDAIWMQKYLVWTIPISFQNNLFSYVMMVSGAAKVLLLFTVLGTIVNLVLNFTLIPMMQLHGGCLVIIFTKLLVVFLTFSYCRVSLGFVRFVDLVFPFILGVFAALFFVIVEPILTLHPSVAITLIIYLGLLFGIGPKFIGHFPTKTN
ncbi:MAG: polysaccharide biosynthesis C-terminal domain-containing protein, partial [Pseudomonadota bacterium]